MLYALGLTTDEIFKTFYETRTYVRTKKGWTVPFDGERALGTKLSADLVNAKDGKVAAKAGTKLTRLQLKKLAEAGLTKQLVGDEALVGRYLADDLIDETTGEIFVEAGDEIDEELLEKLAELGIDELPTLDIDHVNVGPVYPQHAGGRQEFEPGRGAVRNLPRHAPGRAADDRYGGDAVQGSVFRLPSVTTCRPSAASR